MDRMTRAEAARALGIDKSTMTRWVQKHPALVGDDGLVNLDELREHRDAVVNPKLQTRGRAVTGQTVERAPRQSAPVLNDHRARGEYAKAVEAELNLADRLKLTLVRQDVEQHIAAAGELLKRKAGEVAKAKAETLARIEDPRAMERALDELMRSFLEQGANALILALAEATPDEESDAA